MQKVTQRLTSPVPPQQIPENIGEKFDEEITMTRLFVSRMKSEVKQLASKCQSLQSMHDENEQKLQEAENELSASNLLVQQVGGWISEIFCAEISDPVWSPYCEDISFSTN